MTSTEPEELTQEELVRLGSRLNDPLRALALLPKKQQERFKKAHESVINARRVAESRAGALRLP